MKRNFQTFARFDFIYSGNFLVGRFIDHVHKLRDLLFGNDRRVVQHKYQLQQQIKCIGNAINQKQREEICICSHMADFQTHASAAHRIHIGHVAIRYSTLTVRHHLHGGN